MSYILKALEKKQASEQVTKHSDKVSVNHSPVIHTSSNHSIAWGVLLTVAIFSALCVGFYLGNQSRFPFESIFNRSAAANNQTTVNNQTTIKPHQLASQPQLANKGNEQSRDDHIAGNNNAENNAKKNSANINTANVNTANNAAKDNVPTVKQANRLSADTTSTTNTTKPSGVSVEKVASIRVNKQSLPIDAEKYFESPPATDQKPQANKMVVYSPNKTKKVSIENIDQQAVIETPALEPELSLEEVPEDLLARFQLAIDDIDGINESTIDEEPASGYADPRILPLSQMPKWLQDDIPELSFDMHIYASDGTGWVKVNGEDRTENQQIAKGVILDKIEPQTVILTYKGHTFSMAALSNW